MIGRTLSHYKVLEELSRGGMGIVYRALDLKLDREVALIVLPPELVADPGVSDPVRGHVVDHRAPPAYFFFDSLRRVFSSSRSAMMVSSSTMKVSTE